MLLLLFFFFFLVFVFVFWSTRLGIPNCCSNITMMWVCVSDMYIPQFFRVKTPLSSHKCKAESWNKQSYDMYWKAILFSISKTTLTHNMEPAVLQNCKSNNSQLGWLHVLGGVVVVFWEKERRIILILHFIAHLSVFIDVIENLKTQKFILLVVNFWRKICLTYLRINCGCNLTLPTCLERRTSIYFQSSEATPF